MTIKKVLVNDDHDAIVDSVANILNENEVKSIHNAHSCDEAFLKIKRAKFEKDEFDLLITDLCFKQDHKNVTFTSGEELIHRLREDFPNISIIVYSMKDQLLKVRRLVKKYQINAYVCKDRRGSIELAKAVKVVQNGRLFLSPQVSKALQPKSELEINDFDIKLINLLSKGMSQEDISEYLKMKNITPNSLSTIEKRLNKLKIRLRAKNVINLVAISKDIGII